MRRRYSNFGESGKAQNERGVTRRALLGAGAGAALVGAGAMAAKGTEGFWGGRGARERSLARAESFSAEVSERRMEIDAKHEVRGGERSELDIIMAKSDRDSIDGKPCAVFFRDEVEEGLRAEGVPHDIAAELAHLVPGLIAKESRFDNAAEGRTVTTRFPDGHTEEEQAQGRIQALPSTFDEYGRSEGFDRSKIHDSRTQARFVVLYLKKAYRLLHNSPGFVSVQEKYFPGESDDFKRTFLVPAIINSYHSGIGTMQDVVGWFAQKRFRAQLLRGSYDVYREMGRAVMRIRENESRRSELTDHARLFGPHAEDYFPDVFAYAGAIGDALSQRFDS